jgi:hypothetical protein
MKKVSRTIAAMAVAAATGIGCASMEDSKWVTLVDGGKGIENFDRVGDVNWRTEGGAIVGDKSAKGGHLVSKKSYKDFQLQVEFWADTTTNSGIFMRCLDRNKITDKTCYEANIFDMREDQTYATGGIVHRGAVKSPTKAGGKWNTYDITLKGDRLVVVLNGTQTVDTRHSQFKSGPIALQYGAGAVKFRKVQVRPL